MPYVLRLRPLVPALFGVLLLLALAAPCRSAQTGELVVTVAGIDAAQGGEVVILLYADEEAWLEPERALARKTMPAAAAAGEVRFAGIPYGEGYALQAFHDRNGNGRMDMRWFPYPKPAEGAGVSNNVLRFGPPAYDSARFALEAPAAVLRIELSY